MNRVAVLSLAAAAFALVDARAQSTIDFDHAAGGNVNRTVKASDGHVIVVNIDNTCPKFFNYEYVGYEGPKLPEAERDGGSALLDPTTCEKLEDDELKSYVDLSLQPSAICLVESRALRIPHESKYGGYLVEVTRIDPKVNVRRLLDKNKLIAEFSANAKAAIGPKAPPCATVKQQAWEKTLTATSTLQPLADSSLLITVQQTGWTFGIAGGFTASKVTDREFAVIPNDATDAADDKIVIRDRSGEDNVALGAAAMIHLYNPDLKGWMSHGAITFGLGINESNTVSYFLGPSFRFGNQAFLTFGVNTASVNTLPSGQREGAAPQSDNVLNNLGSKTEAGLFLSLSYSFLNPGEGSFKGAFATKSSGQPPAATK